MSTNPLTSPLTPSHLTLLLKHHKSTVLLSTLPSTPISDLKTLLLAALTSRGIATLPSTNTSLPTSPDELELGILLDKKDASKGFKLLSEGRQQQQEEDTKSSKKGKGRPSKGGSSVGGTVEAAGLTDGSWVAYRIRNGNVKEEEDEEGNMMVDIDDPGWDVVVPSFEEADAVEEEAKDEEDDDIPIPDVAKVR